MLSYQVEENLEMRLVSVRYAEEVCQVVRNNLDYLNRWLPWATAAYSPEMARDFFRARLIDFAENEAMSLLIFRNDKAIGGIGFNAPDFINKSTEIGYWLAEDAQGNGIMTKCCRMLINYCFDQIDLERIVIRCATENIKSQAIPERLGFTEEGIARNAEWLHNRFVSLKIYSMLKEEWENI